MIIGTGIDLAESQFFAQAHQNQDFFLKQTFTEQELATATQGPTPIGDRLAARFAAKEAFYKALCQTTLHRRQEQLPLYYREVEVCMDASGRPFLEISGQMAELAGQRGVRRVWLALSHERGLAVAMVTLEG